MAKVSVDITKTVDVDVGLDDLDDDELLDEIVTRGLLSRSEAIAIGRGGTGVSTPIGYVSTEERADLLAQVMLGRRDEALIRLERALGSEFIGRLAPA